MHLDIPSKPLYLTHMLCQYVVLWRRLHDWTVLVWDHVSVHTVSLILIEKNVNYCSLVLWWQAQYCNQSVLAGVLIAHWRLLQWQHGMAPRAFGSQKPASKHQENVRVYAKRSSTQVRLFLSEAGFTAIVWCAQPTYDALSKMTAPTPLFQTRSDV